jgi:prefoldin subunit 5
MMCLSVGLGSVVELTYAEAVVAAKERTEILAKKCETCDGEISECVNDIEEVLATLQQLQQMHGVGPTDAGAPVV